MSSDKQSDVLKDLTLKVYHLLLKEDKPLSIRAVQRKLELSSPSLAFYHLNKLENVGLIKQTPNGYVVDSVLLGDLIRLKRMFIPRFVFYVGFFLFVLIVELTIYKPAQPTAEYVFNVLVSLSATLLFTCESIRTWSREKNRGKG